MTDPFLKSPIAFSIGLLFLFSIPACQTEKSAEDIAISFWSSIVENNFERAKQYCTIQTLPSVLYSQQQSFKNTTFSYGRIVIDKNHATIETKIVPASNNKSSFTTFLLKTDNHWQVDCQRSFNDLYSHQLFKKFFKNLNTLGEEINKKLKQQLPIIEKEIESFGEELKQKIDDFSHELEKPHPKKKVQNPYQKSI